MSDAIMTTEEMQMMFPDLTEKVKAKIDAKERELAWLKQRHGKFTASTFHKMFTSKYAITKAATAQTYIKEKAAETLGAFNEQASSASLRLGNDHEAEAIEAYEKKQEYIVDSGRGFLEKSEHVGCTPDGYVYESYHMAMLKVTNKIVQIKCPYTVQKHFEYLTYKTAADLKEGSKEYYVQVNFEMYVTGADSCDFVSYDKRFPEHKQLAILEVPRDEEMISKIDQALEIAIQTKAAYIAALSDS